MTPRNLLFAILTATLLGCATSPEPAEIEMGSQAGNPPSIGQGAAHPEKYITALMNGAIEAATRLHFAYDASRFDSGHLKVTAQWKNSPVVIGFHFIEESDGLVNYTSMRECNGAVLAEKGDAKILDLFLLTLNQVMDEKQEHSASEE